MSVQDNEGRWQLSMIEKIVGGAMLGLLCWMAVSVQQMSVDIAVLKNELSSSNRDRFTVQEGQRLADRIQRAEERIVQLETHIKEVR